MWRSSGFLIWTEFGRGFGTLGAVDGGLSEELTRPGRARPRENKAGPVAEWEVRAPAKSAHRIAAARRFHAVFHVTLSHKRLEAVIVRARLAKLLDGHGSLPRPITKTARVFHGSPPHAPLTPCLNMPHRRSIVDYQLPGKSIHSLTLASMLPDASIFPSGLKLTVLTAELCAL